MKIILMTIILSLPFSISAKAQTQSRLAVLNAVKNFLTTPFRSAKKIISNIQYNKLKSQSTDEVDSDGNLSYCIDNNDQPLTLEQAREYGQLASAFRKQVCACKAWGDCAKSICPCEMLCPETLKILTRPPTKTSKDLSKEEEGLAFRNGYTTGKYDETHGYCWGHARVTSQFNRLAFFEPDTKPDHDINSDDPREQNKAIRDYKKAIDQIVKNKPAKITGFKNLKEFSDHPALQSYLSDKIAKSWANNAMTFQGLGVSMQAFKRSDKYYEKVFNNIKERLDLNLQPTIVFTMRGAPFFTHAALVSHYETLSDGRLKLCIRDNNRPETKAITCEDNIIIDEEKGATYSSGWWGELGGLSIASNDIPDTLAQTKSLSRKCQKDKKCP